MIQRLNILPEPPTALLNELAETAAATAGMTASMLDRRALRQTLHRRIEATHQKSPETYLTLYRNSPTEQSAFLEGILNHETCFFRDAAVFTELQRWAKQWFATNKRPMRILSAPCSTGEEPYSIAALLEPTGQFTIDALDLSAAAVTHAQTGIYTGLSLRNIPHPTQSTFLDRHPQGWQVAERLRKAIYFRQANLLAPQALPHRAYDLICSRNLLIYQTPEARRQVAQALAEALAPNGRLILGAADWGRDLDTLFHLQQPIHSFALELRTEKPSASATTRYPDPSGSGLIPPQERGFSPRVASSAPPSQSDRLADISTLYRQALEAFLHPDEPAAERLCRKILYLDNDHLPSLELLAKIQRPRASTRLQLALSARLTRHRQARGATA